MIGSASRLQILQAQKEGPGTRRHRKEEHPFNFEHVIIIHGSLRCAHVRIDEERLSTFIHITKNKKK